MPEMVKVMNGREHVMTIEQAAERLRFFGLKVTDANEALHVFEIAFPFSAGARSADSSIVIEVKGTSRALLRLQEAVNS